MATNGTSQGRPGKGLFLVTLGSLSGEYEARDADEAWAMFNDAHGTLHGPHVQGRRIERIATAVWHDESATGAPAALAPMETQPKVKEHRASADGQRFPTFIPAASPSLGDASGKKCVVKDAIGERTLIAPPNDSYAGNSAGSIVLDIEARTNTRLRDGENPVWFIRLHKDFMDRRDPNDNVSFATFCARRHADKVEQCPKWGQRTPGPLSFEISDFLGSRPVLLTKEWRANHEYIAPHDATDAYEADDCNWRVREIERLTGTRLCDGGDAGWFLDEYDQFVNGCEPKGGDRFTNHCRKCAGQPVEILPTQVLIESDFGRAELAEVVQVFLKSAPGLLISLQLLHVHSFSDQPTFTRDDINFKRKRWQVIHAGERIAKALGAINFPISELLAFVNEVIAARGGPCDQIVTAWPIVKSQLESAVVWLQNPLTCGRNFGVPMASQINQFIPPADPADSQATPTVKPKRSTSKNEARLKIVAALLKHHKYDDGSCLNLDPIGNNELARMAYVAESTVSSFFTKQYGGWETYRVKCRDAGSLAGSLRLLNGDLSPVDLYGRSPPDEQGRDEDE